MGCCLSSATPTDKSSSAQKHPHFPRSEQENNRAPPPVVDEETVKEVLSETPNLKQEPVFDVHRNRAHHQEEQESEEDNNTVFYELKLDRTEEVIQDKKTTTTTQEPVLVQKLKLVEFEKSSTFETSDQATSEICSVTNDSVSTTTAATTRDEYDYEEVVYQPPKRFNYSKSSPVKVQNSPSSFGPPGRREQLHQQNRVVGMSPTRRVESSPGRRYGPNSGSGSVARAVHHHQQEQQTVGSKRVGSNRRDPGESSGRRSRSPATRVTPEGGGGVGNNVGRSPSAKRSGRYPGRTHAGPVESSGGPARRLAEEPKMESNYPTNESLDNPLVSLECFIFL